MPHLSIIPNLELESTCVADKALVGTFVQIGRMPKGTKEGESTVFVFIQLENGQLIAAETTLKLLKGAVEIFKAADIQAAMGQN